MKWTLSPRTRAAAWPGRRPGLLLSRGQFRSLCALALPLWLAACRDSQVVSYRIPKEHDTPAPAPAAPAGMAGLAVAATGTGGLEWTAPSAWQAKPPSTMRKGSYAVGGEGAAGADLAITAFPGDVGGDLANVNRWRGQLGLPPITEAELAAAFTPVTANGLAMKVVDLTGGAQRMLGAIVPQAGATWFFKLTGPEAIVAQAKSAYLEFLQTVRAAPVVARASATPPPAAGPAPDMANTPVIKADGPGLKWTAPALWQEKPATAMRKATYLVPGASGANSELAITAFPGDVGGELANVNRWRGQLQLPPLTAAELPATITRIRVNGLSVTLVDLTGGPSVRLLGAIVPANGATWFFKLTGPADLVATEKPAFLAFLQTLSAP
ncbi:hypothetical protein [Opitutus sp. GAS368]|uniref:hypothetical protein n=1 Tax=Opitutus sp. GAS368 TaxID=1882749 RepID=UPI00087D248D|nr:hypothetical protein [Opitutus sp. GAS368]SDS43953.1 hypothetical protein SAMN05444173_2897 [Opitutus sp. GAS368]